jgi:cyclic pyranopterin phosphate synthase
MCKALDKSMTITDVRLELKTGGKSGDFKRPVNHDGTS